LAVGGSIGKRLTDTEHRVRVEQAKKAPVIVQPPVTQEHQGQQTTVNVEAKPETVGEVKVTEVAQPVAREQEWATGDPRAGVL
jgi:hypothetical protein